jgi:Protein of unknown function (DUF1592)/Protein of unknown function (DUF1588)/Protein of unknown function (DUF1595)/Protein of unknown function (DUF1585)
MIRVRKQHSMRPPVTTKARTCGALACLVAAATAFGCAGSIGDALDDGSGSPTAGDPTAPGGPNDPGQVAGTSCTSPALPRTLRRIPNRRYTNAVRDLLGLTQGPALSGGGGTYDSLIPGDADDITTPLGFEYAQVAEKAAADAPLDKLAPCATGVAERTCAQGFIDRFAARAFRRPVPAAERDKLLAVYDVGRTDADFASGVRLVIETVLQSPSFLYRKAIGTPSAGAFALDAYEIASELGFLFFDSLPDQGLLDAAASGKLATDEGFSAEVDRLLLDSRAKDNLTHVMSMWFGGSRAVGLSKDQTLYPGFGATVQASMVQSKERFLSGLLWDDKGTFTDLLTSPKVWVDKTLADFLGVTAPASGFAPVSLPDERSGILTHPALQAWLATANETSVVHRGLFVFNQILCNQTAPPPAGALDLAAAQTKNLTTERQRAGFRAERSPCKGCHSLFDPMGLVFENYDAVGRFRSTIAGAPVDSSAEGIVPDTLVGHLANAGDMVTRLAKSPEVSLCAAKQVMAYSLAKGVALASEECVAQDVEKRFVASGSQLSELFRAVASSPGFRTRSEGGM